jgi:oligosaccharide repeat unit polymerase
VAQAPAPTFIRRLARLSEKDELLPGPVLLGMGLSAFAVIGLVVLVGQAPVAWLLLGTVGVVMVVIAVDAIVTRRFFEPLSLIAFASVFILVLRPLQLFVGAADLLSYYPPSDPVQGLLLLENQEVALFATTRVSDIQQALTQAAAAAALFTCCLVVGYFLPPGKAAGRWLSRAGRLSTEGDPRVVVPICLAIGLVGQVAIIQRAGGLSAAAENIGRGTTLGSGFALIVVSSFAIAGVLVWVLWRPPKGRLQWAVFAAVCVEISGFYALGGSRARVFLLITMLAIIWHYRWRAWRLRELGALALVFAVFASGYLVVRSGTFEKSFGQAVVDAPARALDPRVVLNDNTGFDGLFFATTLFGSRLSHENGQGIVDSVLNFVPSRIYPDKPEAVDAVFREQVFGDRISGGGRPYMVLGEFFRDFGYPGIAVGALLLGMLMRALIGLVRPPNESLGRNFRIGLYAIGAAVLYELFIGTYSIGIGFAITLGFPFVFAVYALGRLPLGSQAIGRGG